MLIGKGSQGEKRRRHRICNDIVKIFPNTDYYNPKLKLRLHEHRCPAMIAVIIASPGLINKYGRVITYSVGHRRNPGVSVRAGKIKIRFTDDCSFGSTGEGIPEEPAIKDRRLFIPAHYGKYLIYDFGFSVCDD